MRASRVFKSLILNRNSNRLYLGLKKELFAIQIISVLLHPENELKKHLNGVLAHLVEHLVRNQKVTGSTPVYSTE